MVETSSACMIEICGTLQSCSSYQTVKVVKNRTSKLCNSFILQVDSEFGCYLMEVAMKDLLIHIWQQTESSFGIRDYINLICNLGKLW